MSYRVKLENFDGPLDLLLFLIKRNELDLLDIPIAEVTQQYLEYLDIIRLLDLEGASDYILMAATLMRIKAKMLLPKPPIEVEEEEEEDPRDELVRRLLDYQRFKEVASTLSRNEEERRLTYKRANFDKAFMHQSDTVWEPTEEFTLFDLIGAFKTILRRAPQVTEHNVQQISVTTDEQAAHILEQLEKNDGQILFYEMMEQLASKMVMIVSFLALLELIRSGTVEVTQSSVFGEIWIRTRE